MRGSAGPKICITRSGRQHVEVLALERTERLDREPRQVELHLRVQDLADLVPAGVDVVFLVLAHDLGAVAGRAAVARVQVQVGEPVLAELRRTRRTDACAEDLMLLRVPGAHHRRLDLDAAPFGVGRTVPDRVGDLVLRAC